MDVTLTGKRPKPIDEMGIDELFHWLAVVCGTYDMARHEIILGAEEWAWHELRVIIHELAGVNPDILKPLTSKENPHVNTSKATFKEKK